MGVCVCKSSAVRPSAMLEPQLEKYKFGEDIGCGRYGRVRKAIIVNSEDTT